MKQRTILLVTVLSILVVLVWVSAWGVQAQPPAGSLRPTPAVKGGPSILGGGGGLPMSYLRLTNSSAWDERPAAAYNWDDNEFLVVWEADDLSGNAPILGQRVGTDGLMKGVQITIESGGFNWQAKVAYNSWAQQYLVVYTNRYSNTDYDVRGRFVNRNGTVGGPIALDAAWGTKEWCPVVTYSAYVGDWLVAYQAETSGGSGFYRILGRRVADDDNLIDTTAKTIDSDTSRSLEGPAVPLIDDGNPYLVAYQRIYSSTDWDVLAQRLSYNLTQLGRLYIAESTSNDTGPALALGPYPYEHLVVWATEAAGGQNDIRACRVTSGGSALNSFSLLGATDSLLRQYPSVGLYANLYYLAAWQTFITGSTRWNIFGSTARVNSSNRGTGEFVIQWSDGDQVGQAVACAKGDVCLVAEEDDSWGGNPEIAVWLVWPLRSSLPMIMRHD